MGQKPTMPSNLLSGTKIRLSALTEVDVPTFTPWYQDAKFLRRYDSRPAYPKTRAELAQWLVDLQKDKDIFAFAVRPLESEELLGYLELDGVIWQHGVCGMGLGLGDRANWGRGYGLEAAQLALGFAFQELNMNRVQASVLL